MDADDQNPAAEAKLTTNEGSSTVAPIAGYNSDIVITATYEIPRQLGHKILGKLCLESENLASILNYVSRSTCVDIYSITMISLYITTFRVAPGDYQISNLPYKGQQFYRSCWTSTFLQRSLIYKCRYFSDNLNFKILVEAHIQPSVNQKKQKKLPLKYNAGLSPPTDKNMFESTANKKKGGRTQIHTNYVLVNKHKHHKEKNQREDLPEHAKQLERSKGIEKETDDLHAALSGLHKKPNHHQIYSVYPVTHSGPGQTIPKALLQRLEVMSQQKYQKYVRNNLTPAERDRLLRKGCAWRRKSFPNTWQHADGTDSSISKMAAAGFHYENGNVRCAYCSVFIQNWSENVDPETVHARRSANCKLVRSAFTLESRADLQMTGLTTFPSFDQQTTTERTVILPYSQYKLKIYETLEDRVNSFPDELRLSHKKSMETATQNGFFYIKQSNLIRCYCCELSLALPDDGNFEEIWHQHASLAPDCDHLKLQKGTLWVEYLRSVLPPNQRSESSIDRMSNASGSRVSCHFAKYPDYVVEVEREASFALSDWSALIYTTPKALAESGFFRLDGEVRCFYCQLDLKISQAIAEGFDPLRHHTQHAPNCNYVIQMNNLLNIQTVADVHSELPDLNTNFSGYTDQVAEETPAGKQQRHPLLKVNII